MDKELEKAIKNGHPCSVIHFDEKGTVTHTENYNLENVRPSKWQIEALARCFLPHIRDFFASEEGQRQYNEWQQEEARKKQCQTKMKK